MTVDGKETDEGSRNNPETPTRNNTSLGSYENICQRERTTNNDRSKFMASHSSDNILKRRLLNKICRANSFGGSSTSFNEDFSSAQSDDSIDSASNKRSLLNHMQRNIVVDEPRKLSAGESSDDKPRTIITNNRCTVIINADRPSASRGELECCERNTKQTVRYTM